MRAVRAGAWAALVAFLAHATLAPCATTRGYRWSPEQLPVTWRMDVAHDVPGLPGTSERLEVERAFQAWDDLQNVGITFQRGLDLFPGDPAANRPVFGDGVTSVVFEDPQSQLPPGVLAVTFFDFYWPPVRSDSHPFANFYGVPDIDILVNDGVPFYADGAPCGGGYHFLSVMTKEVGHLIGLGYSSEPGATMNTTISPCEEDPATLSPDDVFGAEIVSPIAAVTHVITVDDTVDPACTDADGFLDSGESGVLTVRVRNNFGEDLQGLSARLLNVPGGLDPRDVPVSVDSAATLAIGTLPVDSYVELSWDVSLQGSTVPGTTSFVVELDGSTSEGPFANEQVFELRLQVEPTYGTSVDSAMFEGPLGIGWASYDIQRDQTGVPSQDAWSWRLDVCAGVSDWWRVLPPAATSACTDPYRDRNGLLLAGPNVAMDVGSSLYFPILDRIRVRARTSMAPGDRLLVLGDASGLGDLATLVDDLSARVEPLFTDIVYDARDMAWACRPNFSGYGPILTFYLESNADGLGDLGLWVDEVEWRWIRDLAPDRGVCSFAGNRVLRGDDPSVPLPLHAVDVTFPWADPGAVVDGAPLWCYLVEGPTAPAEIVVTKAGIDVVISAR